MKGVEVLLSIRAVQVICAARRMLFLIQQSRLAESLLLTFGR